MIEDHLRRVRHLYYAAPRPLRELVGRGYRMLPTRLRLGGAHQGFVDLIRQTDGWSAERMQDLQFELLRHTLEVAYTAVPFYRERFDSHGVRPADLKAPADLARFPYLTKQDVKENFDALVNPAVPTWRHLITTTGGSTAEPMRFLQVKGLTRSKERAFIHAGWARVGYRPGMRAVQLKGRTVGDPARGVHWEYEPIQNILEMDSNYLTPERMPDYLAAMAAFGAEYCIAYPSSIYQVARYLRASAMPAPRFRAIMLASENVYPWQRATLEEVFRCRVFSHYGHSEMVLLGMEGEHDQELHFFPQYGYLELVHDGVPVSGVGAQGELVGTSFHNDLMPFVRYRTQDIGIAGAPGAERPGYPVLRAVEGRLQEFIVTRDQRLISICVMGAAHFDTLDNVAATQYFQDTPGRLEFRVVPRADYTEHDRQTIRKAIEAKVGTDVDVSVVEVDAIARTRSGKHMMIDQRLPLDVLDGGQDLVLSDS